MKRILSLDGGGIRGVFEASFLATVEESLDSPIASYFDLIVGTSTGGIIALGLGLGLAAHQILDFYKRWGPIIFAGSRLMRTLRWLGFSKYSQAPLREALESVFQERCLGESTTRLVIPSVNLDTGEVHIYKTAHHPRFERDYRERVVDVALATAAAPSFFPTHRSASGTPLLDGGLWANNPMGLAAVEAIGVLDWPRDSLRILSVGCPAEPLTVDIGRRYPLGLFYWGHKALAVMMAAQSSASLGTAQLLAGHENVVRIAPVVAPKRFGLDSVREMPSLQGLGETEARKALPELRAKFLEMVTARFKPYKRIGE